jgi:hypothetical protein
MKISGSARRLEQEQSPLPATRADLGQEGTSWTAELACIEFVQVTWKYFGLSWSQEQGEGFGG